MKSLIVFSAIMALALAAPSLPNNNIFEIDISPEQAQQYLNSPPFSEPQLSGKTATLPLVRYDSPSFRSAEAGPTFGHYWKNGQEIENTQDYVEEVYEAQQFHGQDGLGGYAYGYQAPESSKVENRDRSGDVTGSYTFRDGNNDLIKVRYWSDSEGFHQEDNRPEPVLPQAPEEPADVREARLAHEKAWQEAAAAAAQQPDPQGEYVPDQYENEGSASNQQGVYSVPQERQGKAYQGNYQANQYQGNQAPAQYNQQAKSQAQEEEPEPTGPPRGFFYSFTYPVSIIQPKNAQLTGQNIDQDTVAVNNFRQRQ